MQTYARPNLVFVRGEGARLYDAHGKEYLDFAAGIAVNALGMGMFTWHVVRIRRSEHSEPAERHMHRDRCSHQAGHKARQVRR